MKTSIQVTNMGRKIRDSHLHQPMTRLVFAVAKELDAEYNGQPFPRKLLGERCIARGYSLPDHMIDIDLELLRPYIKWVRS